MQRDNLPRRYYFSPRLVNLHKFDEYYASVHSSNVPAIIFVT